MGETNENKPTLAELALAIDAMEGKLNYVLKPGIEKVDPADEAGGDVGVSQSKFKSDLAGIQKGITDLIEKVDRLTERIDL